MIEVYSFLFLLLLLSPASSFSPPLSQIAVYCQREVRRWAAKSQRQSKESNCVQPRARKVTKEVLTYWKKYEKVEKEARKKAEKEAQEQLKLYEEMREVSQHASCRPHPPTTPTLGSSSAKEVKFPHHSNGTLRTLYVKEIHR